ncbi:MAG: hypothetical protein ACK4N5_03920 [Myxococcales bacterium]
MWLRCGGWTGPFVLTLAGCLATGPLPAEDVAPFAACRVDADCVVALNGCCCDLVAVSATQARQFREQFECEHACACPRRPQVCAVCEAGRCELARAGSDRCPAVAN